MSQEAEGPATDMDNFRERRLGTGPQPPGLSPGRLAELRSWIARRAHMDQQIDLLIAASILEQGDL
jgi:hypothetical protein